MDVESLLKEIIKERNNNNKEKIKKNNTLFTQLIENLIKQEEFNSLWICIPFIDKECFSHLKKSISKEDFINLSKMISNKSHQDFRNGLFDLALLEAKILNDSKWKEKCKTSFNKKYNLNGKAIKIEPRLSECDSKILNNRKNEKKHIIKIVKDRIGPKSSKVNDASLKKRKNMCIAEIKSLKKELILLENKKSDNISNEKDDILEKPKSIWITKSDVRTFIRCPYLIYQARKQKVDPSSFLNSDFIRNLAEKGKEFEESIFSKFDWKKGETLEKAIKEGKSIIKTPIMFVNRWHYTLVGIPDMLIPNKRGFYVPLEIKSHSTVEKADLMDLAFYATLLKKYQTDLVSNGMLVLKDKEPIKVDITDDDFEKLERIIRSIASLKEKADNGEDLVDFAEYEFGPKLTSECKTCNLYKIECLPRMERERRLSLVYGIGPSRETKLRKIGIDTIEKLSKISADRLNHRTGLDYSICLGSINRAKSIIKQEPIVFNPEKLPKCNTEIFLDLEYTDSETPWLIGYAIRNNKNIHYFQYFAENKEDILDNLDKFICQLSKLNNFLIYTWSGLSADMVTLEKTLTKFGLKDRFHIIEKNHFDLYYNYFARNVAFPVYKYSVKDIGVFLGFNRKYDISGFETIFLYELYLKNKDKSLKKKLLEYNLDDIKLLIGVYDWTKKYLKKHHTKPVYETIIWPENP